MSAAASTASSSLIRSPSSALSSTCRRTRLRSAPLAPPGSSERHLEIAGEAQLGHVVELADVARHLEERVEAGALPRAEAVAELLEVAGEEAGRIAVARARPRRRAARARSARGVRTRRVRARDRRARRRRAPAPPRRRTPSAARCARARAGRGRSAASDPRRRSSARRRRSAARVGRLLEGQVLGVGSSTFVSTTEVALSGVTATDRTRPRGTRSTSWIESTAPSDETQSRGRRRSWSALRAYSIDEIGAMSSSPSSSSGSARSGTPTTSSTSYSSRWKTGAMLT